MNTKTRTCSICHGKGRLRVRHKGFKRLYFIKCHDCKGKTIQVDTPQKAVSEWNGGWIFDSLPRFL